MFPFNALPLELREKIIEHAIDYARVDPIFAIDSKVPLLTNAEITQEVRDLLAQVPSKQRDTAYEAIRFYTEEHRFLSKKSPEKRGDDTVIETAFEEMCYSIDQSILGLFDITPEEYFEILARKPLSVAHLDNDNAGWKSMVVLGIKLAHKIPVSNEMLREGGNKKIIFQVAFNIASKIKDYDRVEKLFQHPVWIETYQEISYYIDPISENDFNFILYARFMNLNGLKRIETKNRKVVEKAIDQAGLYHGADIIQHLLEKYDVLISERVIKFDIIPTAINFCSIDILQIIINSKRADIGVLDELLKHAAEALCNPIVLGRAKKIPFFIKLLKLIGHALPLEVLEKSKVIALEKNRTKNLGSFIQEIDTCICMKLENGGAQMQIESSPSVFFQSSLNRAFGLPRSENGGDMGERATREASLSIGAYHP